MFYTAAAEAHPGLDGASRKAILRYQDPHPYSYPPIQTYPQSINPYNPNPTVPPQPINYVYSPYTLPPPIGYSPTYPLSQDGYVTQLQNQNPNQYPNHVYSQIHPEHEVEAEPAVFANAGPPGWVYDPTTGTGSWGVTTGTAIGNGMGNGNRWSVGSDERGNRNGGGHGNGEVEAWRTRSEWSSPMPGVFDPNLWNRN